MTLRALVVSTGKNSAWIAVDGEDEPRVAELRRMRGKRFMPVPGDIVHARIVEGERAVVERIEPRTFRLERRTAGGRTKTMGANVDLLLCITALADPPPRLVTLDQLLAFAALEGVEAAIGFTKPDLVPPESAQQLAVLYRDLGYAALILNPKTGEGIEDLRILIAGRHAMLAGVSGVGKSSIYRALGGAAVVGEVSRRGLGRQTTTAARLYRLGGGFLIDSPGVNEFGLGKLAPAQLAALFPELREPASRCRFTDCTHLREPDCAVQTAVGAAVAPSRYASFRSIALQAS